MVVITIREAFIHAHALRHAENAPILHTVFRDGIAYFIGVLALRIMMICLAISQGSVYLGQSRLVQFTIHADLSQ